MKKTLFVMAVLIALAQLIPRSEAIREWDPPWDMMHPNATTQAWEFDTEPLDLTGRIYPTEYDNPFGEPYLTGDFDEWIGEYPGPLGDPTGVIHVGGDPTGTVKILVENNENPLEVKHILLQITSTKSPGPNVPGTNPPGSVIPLTPLQCANGFYVYGYSIAIFPNPEREEITIELPYCTYIDEIIVDSICIPEPGMFALLGSAAIFLVRKRR